MHQLFGQVCVLTALVAAAFGCAAGIVAGQRQSLRGLRMTRQAVYIFAVAMVLANLIMIRALLAHDFSVSYVAQVGSLTTPTHITIVSLWSSLEGSILFWGAILGTYAFFFTYLLRDSDRAHMPYALATILFVGAFFTFLLLSAANPFGTVNPVPNDGPGPNPLLQNHPLMIIHPPMLYLGYVGMTLPFAVAVAALIRGDLNPGWLKVLRLSTLVPWTFLSCGILLGAWWAYEVLGWGGYWAWDPVENASFLPWLAATAYLHSSVVQERKGILKAWTLSLVLAAFLLTILGTFMTRSGVFNSVHSFTQSAIGPIFLAFLAVVLVFSVALVAGRAHVLQAEGQIRAVVSRETAFLFNNLLFVVFTFTVLLGTVFPLLTEAVQGVKLSVGEPYFNRMAVPIGLAIVFLMGVGPSLPWGLPERKEVWRGLLGPAITAIGCTFFCLALGLREILAIVAFALCGFTFYVNVRELLLPAAERAARRKESWSRALRASFWGQRRKNGGYIVHLAVVVIVGAIAASQTYKKTGEASLLPGESAHIGDYELKYLNTSAKEEPHRYSVTALIEVYKNGARLAEVAPKLNFYPTQREPIGTPSVTTVSHQDLYLSLLSFEPQKGGENDGKVRIGLKMFVIPFVAYLWWMLPVIALGSAVSLWPRRKQFTPMPAQSAVQT